MNAAALIHAPRLDQVVATQLTRFIGFLQRSLDCLVIARAGNGHGRVERNSPAAYGDKKPLFAMLEQIKDGLDVFGAQAGFLGDGLLVVALLLQLLNTGEQLQRAEFAASNVFRQAHDEGRFIIDLHDHGGDFLLAQGLEGLEASFAANEQVVLAFATGTGRYDDGFLQTDALYVADDLIEHTPVAFAGIKHFDPIQRNHPKFCLAVIFALVHATLLIRMCRAIPYR